MITSYIKLIKGQKDSNTSEDNTTDDSTKLYRLFARKNYFVSIERILKRLQKKEALISILYLYLIVSSERRSSCNKLK